MIYLIHLAGLFPLLRWVWLTALGGLGANPPEFIIRSSGLWALVALCLTLCITPLRKVLHWPSVLRWRRPLGLYAFFYTLLHVLAWAWWEQNASLAAMLQDILQRPFIAIGVAATVPLCFMALTSSRGWMRRLGPNWQRLHRLIYPIALLSVLHFWLIRAGKNDFFEPYVYGVVVVLLLAWRVWDAGRRRAMRNLQKSARSA